MTIAKIKVNLEMLLLSVFELFLMANMLAKMTMRMMTSAKRVRPSAALFRRAGRNEEIIRSVKHGLIAKRLSSI